MRRAGVRWEVASVVPAAASEARTTISEARGEGAIEGHVRSSTRFFFVHTAFPRASYSKPDAAYVLVPRSPR
jgi:hypothetical protein